MDQGLASLYQYATKVITRASMFLNVARPAIKGWADPSGNVLLTTTSNNPIGAELKSELQSAATAPSLIQLAFGSPLLDVLTAANTPNNDDSNAISQIVFPLATLPFKLVQDVVTGKPQTILDEVTSFPKQVKATLAGATRQIPLFNLPFALINQIDVALSVLPTLQMFKNGPAALQNIDNAFKAYWFGDGFTTVDGDTISRPRNKQTSTADTNILRTLLGPQSGADQVRNAVRITIEAGADIEYDLKKRIDTAVGIVFPQDPPGGAGRKKLISWMQGFAENAEAATTSAVETLVLGGGPVQTNSLIAAAAGTAAGTAAKKAVQHVYLTELGASL